MQPQQQQQQPVQQQQPIQNQQIQPQPPQQQQQYQQQQQQTSMQQQMLPPLQTQQQTPTIYVPQSYTPIQQTPVHQQKVYLQQHPQSVPTPQYYHQPQHSFSEMVQYGSPSRVYRSSPFTSPQHHREEVIVVPGYHDVMPPGGRRYSYVEPSPRRRRPSRSRSRRRASTSRVYIDESVDEDSSATDISPRRFKKKSIAKSVAKLQELKKLAQEQDMIDRLRKMEHKLIRLNTLEEVRSNKTG
eukprot:CAMPEP_0117424090 /NCGR_PEP_ID=MMETSP0758-20121206/4578_1 /TAXON_ID=63605 /ORGANISM="Percolomonas cosmopolitus, Strain AE-1 (ATCC 50343)" /LENGTH=241 /DNA_ID=CAMNT_0005207659 /DNA_START=377 /DNA_END=1098 /DNA_ORIENTATION=-